MNSEEYAEKIRDTRADIDKTLHTLEDKLSPKELWEQAVKWSEGAREFSINFGRTVRENPIPAALMGISLLWLIAGSSRRVESVDVSGIKRKLQGKYSEVKSTVRDTTAEAGDKMRAFSKDIKHRGEHLREQGEELKEKLQSGGSELSARPVLLSALGLAVGALVAMSLPVTRKEEEVLGEPSRKIYRKASEAVGEQLERGKEAAAAAAEAAKEKFMGEETGHWKAGKEKVPGYMESGTH